MKKNANRLKKINQKGNMVNHLMSHFTLNDWIFDAPLYYVYNELLQGEEKEEFNLDLSVIKWKHYIYLYCYGMQTYVVKQKNIPLPSENFDDVIAKRPRQTYFDDILWASSRGKLHVNRKQEDIINLISNSPNIQKAMLEYQMSSEFLQAYPGYTEEELTQVAKAKVRQYASELCAKMKKSVIKTTAWASHKVLKRMYDKIIVDMTDLKMIKNLQEVSKNPVILVPTRKSYTDMILLGYIFFANGLKQPFFSTPSQYQEVKLINRVFRSCGSFYVRENDYNSLYVEILKEYMSILISDKQTICIPLEETREKSGMLEKPNSLVLESVINSFMSGKSSDVDIIPVTINYDRILEGETFPYELVGEEKVQESLSRFIASARYFGTPFGKVCVNFGKKISLQNYVENLGIPQHQLQFSGPELRTDICKSLCQNILEELSNNTVIMSTGPLATALLEHRKGISNEAMLQHIEYIYEEIKARNAVVAENSAMNRGTANAMNLLTEFVSKKRDVFEPLVSPKVDYKNILMLAYYKNTLVHIFFKEMVIGKLRIFFSC